MLNAISQAPPRKEEPERRFTDCWHAELVRPLSEMPGAFDLPVDAVSLMETEPLPENLNPARILYLDTETTGLSGGAGTLAFEVGLGRLTEEGFRITQLMIRDYPEEQFLLRRVLEAAGDCDALCTFNGRSFDLPLLRDRCLMNRLSPAPLEKPHIDLLHIARRVFRLRLKQCNLGRLEEAVLGFGRGDDLPGAQVPERFFSYLKTGEFALLEDVLRHNQQDIASLCILLNHMARMYQAPQLLGHDQDLYAMGHGLERHNHPEEARRCWELVHPGSLHAQSQLRLAQSLRRSGQAGEAAAIWRRMAEGREGGIVPWVELAKYYEHTLRDIPEALACARRALILLAEPGLPADASVQSEKNALQYRCARLRRKLNGRGTTSRPPEGPENEAGGTAWD